MDNPTTSTSTPATKHNLAVQLAIAAAAVAIIGGVIKPFYASTEITSTLISGLLILVLISVTISYLREQESTDRDILDWIKRIVLVIVILPIGIVVVPYLVHKTIQATYDNLPQYTSQAAKDRAEDADIRIADQLEPIGTLDRKVLARYRKLAGNEAGLALAKELAEANKCWGWDPQGKPGARSYQRPCRPGEIADRIKPILDRANADVDAINNTQLKDEQPQPSAPANNVATMFSTGWSWLTHLRQKTLIEVLFVVIVGLAAFLKTTKEK